MYETTSAGPMPSAWKALAACVTLRSSAWYVISFASALGSPSGTKTNATESGERRAVRTMTS